VNDESGIQPKNPMFKLEKVFCKHVGKVFLSLSDAEAQRTLRRIPSEKVGYHHGLATK
jgi:hypothetical protein